jgi:thymidine phosphorylase
MRQAKIIRSVYPRGEGIVESIDTRSLGLAVIELGGGRRVATDNIDHSVGLTHLAGKGAMVDGKLPLCFIHASSEDQFASAQALIQAAYHLGEEPRHLPMVLERIGP